MLLGVYNQIYRMQKASLKSVTLFLGCIFQTKNIDAKLRKKWNY